MKASSPQLDWGCFRVPGKTCEGPNGTRLSASMNNISFVLPTIALLQAYYFGINGVFTTDFPSKPPVRFNYTGEDIPRKVFGLLTSQQK
jgi:laccase